MNQQLLLKMQILIQIEMSELRNILSKNYIHRTCKHIYVIRHIKLHLERRLHLLLVCLQVRVTHLDLPGTHIIKLE